MVRSKRITLILAAAIYAASAAIVFCATIVRNPVIPAPPAPKSVEEAKKAEKKDEGKEKTEIVWNDSLDDALGMAAAEYKPVLVFFYSPECPWCGKMLNEVFPDKKILPLMKNFVPVMIDITENTRDQYQYMISGVPAVLFLSSDGQLRYRIDGYAGADVLSKAFEFVLGPKIILEHMKKAKKNIQALEKQDVPDEMWPEIMIAMGKNSELRSKINELILKFAEFPAETLIKLLEDKRLAVRLGALEILEEITGDSFEFDPWLDEENMASNVKSLGKWREWAAKQKGGKVKEMYSSLTRERCAMLLGDIIHGERERSMRAMAALQSGGSLAVSVIDEYMKNNPDLPSATKKKIKEVRYGILIPENMINGKASTLSHKLVYGNTDVRIQSIAELKVLRMKILPILADFLSDPDPMLRESTLDAISEVAPYKFVGLTEGIMKTEKDDDVIFSYIRALAKCQSPKTAAILKQFMESQNEDFVIAALDSAAKINDSSSRNYSGSSRDKGKFLTDEISRCAGDPRWRVRAAALAAITKIGGQNFAGAVEKALDDSDEFVKFKAVEAIALLKSVKSAKKLSEIFMKDDSLKSIIIKTYSKLELRVPDEFVAALKGKDPQILSQIAQDLKDSSAEAMPVAEFLSGNEDPDIACPALSFIASNILKDMSYSDLLVETLEKGDVKKCLAIMRGIDLYGEKEDDMTGVLEQINIQGSETGDSSGEPGIENDIQNAFEDPVEDKSPEKPEKKKNAPKANNAANEGSAVDGILDSFSDDAPSKKKSRSAKSLGDIIRNLSAVMGKIMRTTSDEELKTAAAIALLPLLDQEALDRTAKIYASQDAETRNKIISLISKLGKDEVNGVLELAIMDSDTTSRYYAISGIYKNPSPERLKILLDEVEKKSTKVKVGEVMGYEFSNLFKKISSAKTMREWAVKILNSPASEDKLKILSIIILEKTWKNEDAALVEKFAGSENEWIRREASYALGLKAKSEYLGKIKTLCADKSEHVRVVVPFIVQQRCSSGYSFNSWKHFFDEKEMNNGYGDYSSRRSGSDTCSKEEAEALKQLAEDSSPIVRLESFFSLMIARQPFSLTSFIETIDVIPDYKSVSQRISSFFESSDNYQYLGPEFAVLLPYLDNHKIDQRQMKEIYAHFKIGDDSAGNLAEIAAKIKSEKDIAVTYVEPSPEEKNAVAAPGENPIRLVYFTKKGCPDCKRVEEILGAFENAFPKMIVERQDINKIRALKLNEAYCEFFGVPDKVRLVAPAIFANGGFLIKDDINFDRLGNLISRSLSIRGDKWYKVEEKELEKSAERISGRYQSKVTIMVVMLAGLLDGINPCAFATIIFLISYLHVARRSPWQIVQTGMSFILAVFLTYFALGLGLSEIVGGISAFQNAGIWLNRLMIAFVAVLSILSFYDGILSMRGRMQDMVLQLPQSLKERIRSTIREEARNAHSVVAAFVIGVIISLLEAVCTGQVYAPTLYYIYRTDTSKTGVLYYLTAYNLCFILPLVIIFIFAFYGLKSESLINFMRRHTTLVKFLTALLFLLMLIFLLK